MASVCTGETRTNPGRRLLMSAAVILMACVLASHGDAAGPRQWSVALSGPDLVTADREYRYAVTLTNDGGDWPASARVGRTFRLAFDLSERYGEGTVGIEDIFIHPVGPQAPDGSFPCDAHGGCWFRRSGSQVDFSFTRDNVSVGPVTFDIVVHTASVFRAGDSFRLSASLQGGWQASTDEYPPPFAPSSSADAAAVATFPLSCGDVPGDCGATPLR